ncbi:Img2 [Kluyveromyces lactis]|nr:Img2 [Kluyveromyces lactis]
MLTRVTRSFAAMSPKSFRICTRLQSTQAQQPQPQENSEIELLNELKSEMDKLEPLSDAESAELSALFDSQSPFTVFPKLEDVSPEEVVGAAPFGKKTYFIQRSINGNLPVYTDYKNSNKIVTEIRKIQGDPVQLRNDLQERLPFIPKKYWKVILQSNKIIIEGDATKHVKRALATTF